jgi:hypothetical protein
MYGTSLAKHVSGASMPHAPKCTCECDVHGILDLDLCAGWICRFGCDVACAWSLGKDVRFRCCLVRRVEAASAFPGNFV